MPKIFGEKTLQWGLFFIVPVLFGSSFILIKRSLIIFNDYQVAAARMFIAFLFFLPLIRRYIHKLTAGNAIYIIFVGVLGNALPSFLFARAQMHISSSLAGMLNTLTPLFTLLVGVIFFRAKTRWYRVLGILTGLAGAAGLVYDGSAHYFQGLNWYALLGVLAILSISMSMNIVKYRLPRLRGEEIASLAFMFIGPACGIYLFFSDFPALNLTGYPDWYWIYPVLLGITASFLPVTGVNILVQHTSPIFTSSITYIIPIVAMLWGLLDGEYIPLTKIIFIGIIFAGIFLVNRK